MLQSADGNCTITAQCRPQGTADCVDGKCTCRAKHYRHEYSDGDARCLPEPGHTSDAQKTPVDPVMIGILVSLVLMFLIICIVLQLFSKARFRQNRTILNSANPRLMNTSFLKGQQGKKSATGSRGAGGSRGSRGSIDMAHPQEGDGRVSPDSGTIGGPPPAQPPERHADPTDGKEP
ncbi:uncharacterized protein LOC119090153 [Pollicipes pollicipes]|uniref:uncharacterized protein LOC119090153 n=1 Tax=Pollicipes pollicipes TaxID=41117 RepID=UPI0018853215|nr:uncharacterized protein LOC119090153 [Pollicipes pollicipes]